jgi:hypothetical protein
VNPYALLFLLATAIGVYFAPRKWATVSFLVGCCYMTVGQGVELAGLNLPVIRILVLVGIIRLLLREDFLPEGFNRMDKLFVFWAGWLFFASLFHEWVPGSGPVYMAGALLNTVGFYFMIRTFCNDQDELSDTLVVLCLVLAPVALAMTIERAIQWNFFSIFEGVPQAPDFRNGRFRAQGPFNHAILAGTVGAACFPLAIAIWKQNRLAALIGMTSCLVMVVTCASSGPILSLGAAIFALLLWKAKVLIKIMKVAFIPAYLLLALVMSRPPYFLISKIDLTGASTGYHRCLLIQQTFNHLGEWWLFGTDRTIHWMPNQGFISHRHTDITNQYIAYGVAGGLTCMIVFIAILWITFSTVGRLAEDERLSVDRRFFFWCLGASLFSLAASGISVGYFGQALFFLWFPIAALASFYRPAHSFAEEPARGELDGHSYSRERILP